MRRAFGSALPFVVILLASGGDGCGCSSSGTSSTGPSGADAAVVDAAAHEAGAADASVAQDVRSDVVDPCTGMGPPGGVPAGWIPWGAYDACCGFYVPSSASVLPEPIRWTACESSVQPTGIVCRQMVVDWDWQSDNQNPFSAWIDAEVDGSGGPIIQVTRFVGKTALRLIGGADGPVTQALLETASGKCTAGRSRLASGKYVYDVYEGNQSTGGGGLAGSQSDLGPTSFARFSDGQTHDLIVGAPGVFDAATMRLYAWPDGSSYQDLPSEAGLALSEPLFVGDGLFWSAGSLPLQKIRVWTQLAGPRDLVSFGADTSQGAADLGGDGHDLVWMRGSNRTNPSGLFPVASIMTSAFTTDPASLVPRRLRSETARSFGTTPFVVGCGFAAHQSAGANSFGIRVVRLSDGVSWLLSGDPSNAWRWGSAFALTCTELFAKVTAFPDDGGNARGYYARVRLDSLGAGTPPD